MPFNQCWFAIYHRSPYKGPIPPLAELTSKHWSAILENNYPAIKQEILSAIHSHAEILQPHFYEMTAQKNTDWETIPLITWSVKWVHFLDKFPVINTLTKKIPGLVSVSINKLSAGATIKPHFGETNTTIRSHLGIIVPAGLPECGLSVDGRAIEWKEGTLIGFCDGYLHEAWNNTEQDRYILLLDIVREEFLPFKRKICATCLATYAALFLEKKINLFSFPFVLQNLLIRSMSFAARLFLLFEERFHIAGRIRKR